MNSQTATNGKTKETNVQLAAAAAAAAVSHSLPSGNKSVTESMSSDYDSSSYSCDSYQKKKRRGGGGKGRRK
eukprot:3926949-Ditylum_brightwellii.AAC.1